MCVRSVVVVGVSCWNMSEVLNRTYCDVRCAELWDSFSGFVACGCRAAYEIVLFFGIVSIDFLVGIYDGSVVVRKKLRVDGSRKISCAVSTIIQKID